MSTSRIVSGNNNIDDILSAHKKKVGEIIDKFSLHKTNTSLDKGLLSSLPRMVMSIAMATAAMTAAMPTTTNQSAIAMAVVMLNMPSPSLPVRNKIINDEESDYDRELAVNLQD